MHVNLLIPQIMEMATITQVVDDAIPVCKDTQNTDWTSLSYTWCGGQKLYIFTARCYASVVLAIGLCPSVSVSLSVTSRSSTKTAKHRITQTTPHDSTGTLVFYCHTIAQDLREIRPGSSPTMAPNAGGVGHNGRLSTNNRLYLENGTRLTHGFY